MVAKTGPNAGKALQIPFFTSGANTPVFTSPSNFVVFPRAEVLDEHKFRRELAQYPNMRDEVLSFLGEGESNIDTFIAWAKNWNGNGG
jgi:hypothetical protein